MAAVREQPAAVPPGRPPASSTPSPGLTSVRALGTRDEQASAGVGISILSIVSPFVCCRRGGGIGLLLLRLLLRLLLLLRRLYLRMLLRLPQLLLQQAV